MTKAQKWIAKGAPTEAVEFLNKAVDGLHQIAVEKNIVFKGDEEVMSEVKTEVQAVEETQNVDNVVEETTTTETTVTTDEPQPSVAEVLQKGVADAIMVALKEYNTAVVAPLQAQVAELISELKQGNGKVQKSFEGAQNVFFGASDFMPAAAVSAMLKKEFGSEAEAKAGDVVVKDIKETQVVTEKKITKSVSDSSNVLADF